MAQDIRKLLAEDRNRNLPSLPTGHETRFLDKLEAHMPNKKPVTRRWLWLRSVAAAVLILVLAGAGFFIWQENSANKTPLEVLAEKEIEQEATPKFTLSNISPDLKKVETYFTTAINVELANLEVAEKDQEMADAYLAKLRELGKEYDNLNDELNTLGVNDMTISALIDNLKMRLQLLHRLKQHLNQSKKRKL